MSTRSGPQSQAASPPSSSTSSEGGQQQQQGGKKRGRGGGRSDKTTQRNAKRKKQNNNPKSSSSSDNGGESPSVGQGGAPSTSLSSSTSVGRNIYDGAAAMTEERTKRLDRYFGLVCSMYFGSDGSSGSKNPFKDLCYRYVVDDPDEPETQDPPGKEFDRALLNLYKQKSKLSSTRARLPNRDYNRSFSALALLTSSCRQPEVIDCWGPYEIAVFETALARYGLKGWNDVSREIKSKSSAECEVSCFKEEEGLYISSQEFYHRVYSRTERGRIFTEVLLQSEPTGPATPPKTEPESVTTTPASGECDSQENS